MIVGILKSYKGIAYHKGLKEVHAFASTGTIRTSYSSDYGVTWSDSGVDISSESWTIGDYSSEHKCLVATNGSGVTNQFGYSFNGRNWFYSSPGAQSWESICAFGKRVIMCSLGGANRVSYTDDLINWTSVSVAASDANAWKGIAAGDGILFLVSASGATLSNAAAYSVDGGDSWTLVDTGPIETGTDYRDVIFANGAFAAAGRWGTYNSFVTDHVKDFTFKPLQNGQSVYDQSNKWTWTKQGGVLRPSFEFVLRGVTAVTTTDETVSEYLYLDPADTDIIAALPAGWGASVEIEVSASFDNNGYAILSSRTFWSSQGIAYSTSWTTEANTFAGSLTVDTTPSVTLIAGTFGVRVQASHTTASWVGVVGNMEWVATIRGVPRMPVPNVVC